MRESEAVTGMRRALGRQLAVRRKAAGYLQRELAILAGYSRTAIANAETGSASTARQLWERADRALGTGELFARGYDRIQAQRAAEARATRLAPVARPGRACAEQSWPVVEDTAGRLWLVTGTGVDALEVPRPAGLVAMGWWLYTRGVPDEIRGLPALPDPAGALAMIEAGPACYFLTRSGACPWTRRDTATASPAGLADPGHLAVVRWHADGGRVPAPPAPLEGGQRAGWAHVPAADGQLVSPMALLHLLAQAAAATRQDAGLLLPGGIHAVPAPARPASDPP